MPSDSTELTRREWRELGFYYERDDPNQTWVFIGSRAGLLQFSQLLLEYVANPRHAAISEHDHYGPYWYLKVATWHQPIIDEDIRGPLEDLRRLAELVRARLEGAEPGAQIAIREEFAPDSLYSLVFNVREDGFDPASADPLLKQ
jgi:hypothetical protein